MEQVSLALTCPKPKDQKTDCGETKRNPKKSHEDQLLHPKAKEQLLHKQDQRPNPNDLVGALPRGRLPVDHVFHPLQGLEPRQIRRRPATLSPEQRSPPQRGRRRLHRVHQEEGRSR